MPQDRRENSRAMDSADRYGAALEQTLQMAQLAGSVDGVNAAAEVFMDDAMRNRSMTGQEVADMLKRYASALAAVAVAADAIMDGGGRVVRVEF